MNSLACFDFDGLAIRVTMKDGEPWFYAVDVCRVLEVQNPTDALKSLDEDERMTLDNTEGHSGKRGGAQTFNIISESGLYTLIFKSRKPEAKRFRKWVTSEVLPAIRKTGTYRVPEDTSYPDCLSILDYVREACSTWSLERQADFGRQVRRYAKSMGVLYQVGEYAGLGKMFIFPRQILEAVRKRFSQVAFLPDSDAVEFEKLLDAMLAGSFSGTRHPSELVRGVAKTMRLFPRVFRPDSSVSSERAMFGRICERFNGYTFPSGVQLIVRSNKNGAHYEIHQKQPTGVPTLTA